MIWKENVHVYQQVFGTDIIKLTKSPTSRGCRQESVCRLGGCIVNLSLILLHIETHLCVRLIVTYDHSSR